MQDACQTEIRYSDPFDPVRAVRMFGFGMHCSVVWLNRIMALVCEDLARYGVVLVPPSTAEYFELLADIEQRLQTRPEGASPP